MQLEIFDRIVPVKPDDFSDDYLFWKTDDGRDFFETYSELTKQADVIIAEIAGDQPLVMARHNFQMGQCGCCSSGSMNNVVSISAYRLRGLINETF